MSFFLINLNSSFYIPSSLYTYIFKLSNRVIKLKVFSLLYIFKVSRTNFLVNNTLILFIALLIIFIYYNITSKSRLYLLIYKYILYTKTISIRLSRLTKLLVTLNVIYKAIL